MPIKTGLISYWKLDEASGNALDAHGSSSLTGTASPGTTTGLISGSRTFNGSTQYFSIADNTDLSMSGTGNNLTISLWVKFNSVTTSVMLCKGNNVTTTAGVAYSIYYSTTSNTFVFRVSSASVNTLINASAFGSASTGVWYHILAKYDATAGTISIKVNNGTANSTSHTTGIQNESLAFQLGRDTSRFFNGTLDEIGLWKKLTDSTEDAILYNSGAGESYDNFDPPLNTVAPTLTISTTTWTGTIGTWDSQSNGTLTYAWELRDADDDSVVESGTGSSPSGSGSYSGDYYLWVRASNDGGYDTEEDSVSADETASGATPSGSGSVTAVGALTGLGSTVQSGSGQVTAVGTLTGSGLSVRSGAGSIAAIGSLSGVGLSVRSGTGSVVAIGVLNGVGDAPDAPIDIPSGFGAILAIGTLSGAGASVRTGSGSLSGVARLAGVGFKEASGFGGITAVARLTGMGSDGEGSSSAAHFYYHYFLAN